MIKVLNAGLFSTIQDKGRFGFRNQGVPVSGAMDSISAFFANALLRNKEDAAVLEITLLGPKLLFETSTYFVLTGANLSPQLNEQSIVNYKVYLAEKGSVLSFGKLQEGYRTYLGIKDGFQSPKILGSRSFYANITEQNCLQKGDIFPITSNNNYIDTNAILKPPLFYKNAILEVYKGPEFDWFKEAEQTHFLTTPYRVSKKNNRMGYQLEGQKVTHQYSMITSPVLPGTVQLPPSGLPIVLMRDAQTTGGYPRIFQLSEQAICVLAQKKMGDEVRFGLVDA